MIALLPSAISSLRPTIVKQNSMVFLTILNGSTTWDFKFENKDCTFDIEKFQYKLLTCSVEVKSLIINRQFELWWFVPHVLHIGKACSVLIGWEVKVESPFTIFARKSILVRTSEWASTSSTPLVFLHELLSGHLALCSL